jgi:hypothetical protein
MMLKKPLKKVLPKKKLPKKMLLKKVLMMKEMTKKEMMKKEMMKMKMMMKMMMMKVVEILKMSIHHYKIGTILLKHVSMLDVMKFVINTKMLPKLVNVGEI